MSAPVKSTELKKYKLKFACWTLFTAIGTVGDDPVVKYVTIPQIWKLFQVKKAKIALKWTVARENRIHAGPRFEFKWQFRKLGGL